jgi:uncharacterized membrane protein
MAFGILLTFVAIAGFAITFLGYLGLVGKLPPNGYAGIRTPFTMATSENWYDTHRAAAPIMMFGGILVFAIAMAFVPFAFSGQVSGTVGLVVVIVCGILTVTTAALAWYAGTSYAAARSTRQGP